MKTSITIAALLAIGSSAAGTAALPNPYFGSDTLFNVTRTAITNVGGIGPATAYVGGGSGGGAAAMAGAVGAAPSASKQQTAPMSRMIKKDGNTCGFNGGSKGSADTNTSGIVIGLDAVSVLSSTKAGAQATASCNGAGNGEVFSGSTVGTGTATTQSFAGGGGDATKQNWKWALALVYGGLDLSTCTNGAGCKAADCNSTARANLVANWQNIIQGGACSFNATAGASGISAASACGAGSAANGALWHAFRRDDTSGTSDVFASILGLSPGTSNSFLSGNFLPSPFGASPYCNALNWESTIPLDAAGLPAYDSWPTLGNISGNSLYPAAYDNSLCGAGPHDQFTGPGGVPDPSATSGKCATSGHCEGTTGTPLGAVCVVGGAACGNGSPCLADACTVGGAACASADTCNPVAHRMPPPGITANSQGNQAGKTNVSAQVWGTAPQGIAGTQAWDVLPTQMQDNDPIRRKCIGTSVHNHLRAGEEVCNMDGSLGLVLPMVDSDWIIGASFNGGPVLGQYPTDQCNGAFVAAQAPQVLNCAPRGTQHHDGECPNGDKEGGGLCQIPIDSVTHTSACINPPGVTPTNVTGLRVLPLSSGRSYNLALRDGNTAQGFKTAQYPVNAINATVDYLGAYNRIHQEETILADQAAGCQLLDMTDQIGCLAAADPCSIGFAGFESGFWASRTNGFTGTNSDPAGTWDSDALLIAGVTPTTTTVQALGLSNEYQFSRKLYFNSLPGFGTVNAEGAGGTAGDPTAADEITLAKYESVGGNIGPILTQFSYFPLGPQSPQNGATCSQTTGCTPGGLNPASDTPYCEDYNEHTVCGTANTNVNGCLNNNTVSGIPGAGVDTHTTKEVSTICGNGIVEAFEECDGTINAGAGGRSATCRCNLDYNVALGHCN